MNILTGDLPASANYKKGRNKTIKYIVIHYTGNNGDTALNNINYFKNNVVEASAHFFVDEQYIYSSVPINDTAYHCGTSGKYYHNKCRNANSIGIELCSIKVNGKYTFKKETINNAIELTRYLMDLYNISIENVIRHYDVTHKNCPAPYVDDINAWNDFKNRLMEDEPMTDVEREQMQTIQEHLNNLTNIVNNLNNKINGPIYNWVDENMPEWARDSISRLYQQGYLKGDDNGALNLNEDMLRMLVIVDRIINK